VEFRLILEEDPLLLGRGQQEVEDLQQAPFSLLRGGERGNRAWAAPAEAKAVQRPTDRLRADPKSKFLKHLRCQHRTRPARAVKPMLVGRFLQNQLLQPLADPLLQEQSWFSGGAVIKGFLPLRHEPPAYLVDRGTGAVQNSGDLGRRELISQQQDNGHPQPSRGFGLPFHLGNQPLPLLRGKLYTGSAHRRLTSGRVGFSSTFILP